MIHGEIRGHGDAIVSLVVRGQHAARIEFVVDTGFTEWLALPRDVIESLGLSYQEEDHYFLADGTRVAVRVFVAHVEWMSAWRRVMVIEMDGGPLMGMGMLRGCRMTMDVIENGPVLISPLG